MNTRLARIGAALSVVSTFIVVTCGAALAQTSAPTPESLATDAGTSFRDTGIAVVAVLIPLAVALILAKKALPWARQMLHI